MDKDEGVFSHLSPRIHVFLGSYEYVTANDSAAFLLHLTEQYILLTGYPHRQSAMPAFYQLQYK